MAVLALLKDVGNGAIWRDQTIRVHWLKRRTGSWAVSGCRSSIVTVCLIRTQYKKEPCVRRTHTEVLTTVEFLAPETFQSGIDNPVYSELNHTSGCVGGTHLVRQPGISDSQTMQLISIPSTCRSSVMYACNCLILCRGGTIYSSWPTA